MEETAKPARPKRKPIIYIVVVAVFLVLCAAYMWRALATADASTSMILREWADTARENLDNSLNLGIKDLQFFLRNGIPEYRGGGESARKELFRLLEAKYPGQTFLYVAEDGTAFDSGGESRGRLISPSVRRKSRSAGMTVTTVLDSESEADGKHFAQVVPLPGSGYVMYVRENNEFAKSSLARLSVAGDYLALFDVNGDVISSVVKFESGETESAREELRADVVPFLQSGESRRFIRRGWHLVFHCYLLLDRDEGLVLGARVPAAQLLPFFGDMMRFSTVIFFIILFLIFLIIALDIVNDREKARELHKISFLDFLTGLLNELGMHAAIKEFLRGNMAGNNSLVCLDMVQFRRFNAMFGYGAGDKVLRTIAGVLGGNYSTSARISGDVFACIAPTVPDMAEALNRRLRDAVREEMGEEYLAPLAFKFGFYPMRGGKHTIGEVYDGALLALRNAKKEPKRLAYIYDGELQRQAQLQRRIELNMLHALSADEFRLYVQPKYDVAGNQCCGGEVLVRWHSDDIGDVMPADFIPVFEKNGFIVELDFHVLSTIFRNLREELDRGLRPPQLSINQSRATIAFSNYLPRLKGIIAQFHIPTEYIELEITESFLGHDYGALLSLMHKLKDLGFSLAMDDFGAGYSSLNTLRELPVDTLKIDKAFLDESDNSLRSRTIIRNIINMAHELGVSVVCEGVETERQQQFLLESGCNIIQGYYYSKPLAYNDYADRYYRNRHAAEGTAT